MKPLLLLTATGLLAAAVAACGGNVTVSSSGNAGSESSGGAGGSGGSSNGSSGDTSGDGGTGGGIVPTCDPGADPIAGLASSIARPNGGSGWLEVDLSTAAGSCADPYYFPADCQASMRLRLDIPPEAQQPGSYPLNPGSTVFAYLDGQGPGGSSTCQNTGNNFNGTLVITQLGGGQINGTIGDSDTLHGNFCAPFCGACLGTGESCSNDGQCCNLFCDPGAHTCAP